MDIAGLERKRSNTELTQTRDKGAWTLTIYAGLNPNVKVGSQGTIHKPATDIKAVNSVRHELVDVQGAFFFG